MTQQTIKDPVSRRWNRIRGVPRPRSMHFDLSELPYGKESCPRLARKAKSDTGSETCHRTTDVPGKDQRENDDHKALIIYALPTGNVKSDRDLRPAEKESCLNLLPPAPVFVYTVRTQPAATFVYTETHPFIQKITKYV